MDWIRLIKAIGIAVIVVIQCVIIFKDMTTFDGNYSKFVRICQMILATEMVILFFTIITCVAYICL